MHASICGLGTWLPESVRTNDAWPASFAAGDHLSGDRTFNDIPPAQDPVAAAILQRHLAAEARDPFLGAERRHVADPACTAAQVESSAAAAALQEAGVEGAEVDLVLSNSAVPDRLIPSTASRVAQRIGATRALALGVESTCASALTQLEMARAYVESGLARIVLLTQSHLLLRTFPMMHPAAPGLGDGASAMVVAARSEGLRIRSTFTVTHGEFADAVTWTRGATDELDIPWWKQGGDFQLGSRDSAGVKLLMRDTVSFGAQTIREAARRAEIEVDRIDLIVSVQPRGFIPGAIAERLGLPPQCAVTTYDRIAHLGVCGPVFNLACARDTGRLHRGMTVALYAQGAGFTRAAAIVEAG